VTRSNAAFCCTGGSLSVKVVTGNRKACCRRLLAQLAVAWPDGLVCELVRCCVRPAVGNTCA
jgi:hypothetical protein